MHPLKFYFLKNANPGIQFIPKNPNLNECDLIHGHSHQTLINRVKLRENYNAASQTIVSPNLHFFFFFYNIRVSSLVHETQAKEFHFPDFLDIISHVTKFWQWGQAVVCVNSELLVLKERTQLIFSSFLLPLT